MVGRTEPVVGRRELSTYAAALHKGGVLVRQDVKDITAGLGSGTMLPTGTSTSSTAWAPGSSWTASTTSCRRRLRPSPDLPEAGRSRDITVAVSDLRLPNDVCETTV